MNDGLPSAEDLDAVEAERIVKLRTNCRHEWRDTYYGTECIKCDVFYPYGQAPWDAEEEQQ